MEIPSTINYIRWQAVQGNPGLTAGYLGKFRAFTYSMLDDGSYIVASSLPNFPSGHREPTVENTQRFCRDFLARARYRGSLSS